MTSPGMGSGDTLQQGVPTASWRNIFRDSQAQRLRLVPAKAGIGKKLPMKMGMPSFTRECQQIFMSAILAFHTGKTIVRIAAVEKTIDHLLDIGPPEAVQP